MARADVDFGEGKVKQTGPTGKSSVIHISKAGPGSKIVYMLSFKISNTIIHDNNTTSQ